MSVHDIRPIRRTPSPAEVAAEQAAIAQWGVRVGRWKADCWSWIAECVWTKDEATPTAPLKPFPVAVCRGCQRYVGQAEAKTDLAWRTGAAPMIVTGRCRVDASHPLEPLVYLPYCVRAWQAAAKPEAVIAFPKPRRMLMSWAMIAAHLWLALFWPYVAAYVVSSKEEKSGELVGRAAHILRMLVEKAGWPAALVPKWTAGHFVPGTQNPLVLTFQDTGSKLVGVAEGADQLRQYTATAILADEVGTWKWPRATYTAMQPCIQGGGKITLLSSAYPGFWRQFVAGELTQ